MLLLQPGLRSFQSGMKPLITVARGVQRERTVPMQDSRGRVHPTTLSCASLLALLLLIGALAGTAPLVAEQATLPYAGLPAGTPQSWAEAAARNQLSIIDSEGTFPLRYRVRRRDAKGDTTRVVIQTRDGAVARLIERDGKPISSLDDQAERQRLQDELASRSDFLKRHKRNAEMRQNISELVRLMPQAMLNTYTPGQPQPAGATSQQVVLDFRPNPAFKPPSMMANLLTGVEGRVWIDSQSHCMTRIEGHILHPINFGWGLVAHIYPGGTVELEQRNAGGDHWVYSHFDTHLTVRVIVKSVPMDNQMTTMDFQALPASVSLEDGILMLLSLNLPAQ